MKCLGLRPLKAEEIIYTYEQSNLMKKITGCIALARGSFKENTINSPIINFCCYSDICISYHFLMNYHEMENILMENPVQCLLKSKKDMVRYLCKRPEAVIKEFNIMIEHSTITEYGFRIDEDPYSYLIICNPSKFYNDFYIYCYLKDCLDAHIESAKNGITFIDYKFNEILNIEDGQSIDIIKPVGDVERKFGLDRETKRCRYVDDTHVEVKDRVYHICDFAELLSRANCKIERSKVDIDVGRYD